VDRVWELAGDVSRYAEWVESTVSMGQTDGSARLGLIYDERTRIIGPWIAVTRWRVTEFEPPRRQVHEGVGFVIARGMAVIIELRPVDENTHFVLTVRYTPRLGPIGALIDRVVRGMLTRAQQRSVNVFAALVVRS
jgi:polyketide cyclase/dehydrase/lipid transport protein